MLDAHALDLAPGLAGNSIQAHAVVHDAVVVAKEVIIDHAGVPMDGMFVVMGHVIVVRVPVVKAVQGNVGVIVEPEPEIEMGPH